MTFDSNPSIPFLLLKELKEEKNVFCETCTLDQGQGSFMTQIASGWREVYPSEKKGHQLPSGIYVRDTLFFFLFRLHKV